MSLDLSLGEQQKVATPHECECGHKHTFNKWEYYCDLNITHNLGKMADKAGLYYALWRPEEKGWSKGEDVIPALQKGIKKLEAKPEYFKQFNPDNGWGSYEGLLKVAREYLSACENHPTAKIFASR